MACAIRLLVCGGRDFQDEDLAFSALDKFHAETPVGMVIEGGQRTYINGKLVNSADLLACRWSYRVGIPGRRFDADWKAHGKAAGPIRNQRMIDEGKPDVVIAFPGGRGTRDMIKRAKAAGIPVKEVSS